MNNFNNFLTSSGIAFPRELSRDQIVTEFLPQNATPASPPIKKVPKESSEKKEKVKEVDKFQKHLDSWKKQLIKAKDAFLKKWNSNVEKNGKLSDFQLFKTVGTGAFGTVVLAKNKATEQPVAIKFVEKKAIVKQSQVVHIKNEVKLLSCCKFIFLVRMEYFFQDNVYLFVGMQFINGGEMFSHLKRLKRFEEQLSKFYASQVILAFEYLHYNGIVHRDLKPENVLIAADGYLKVCDFGFCKKIDDNRTYTSCGTPDYLAPEIILNKGHSYAVDWWSLGILIYEMTAGYPPFSAESHMKLYEKIVEGKFRFPTHFSKNIRDLLNNLIMVDRTKRFGCLQKGVLDIKTHNWFCGHDWDGILTKAIKPSYKPAVQGIDDTANFLSFPENKLRYNSINEYSAAFADFNKIK